MTINTKNNQLNVKEVRSQIRLNKETLRDANKVVKADSDVEYLIGINIPIGEIQMAVPKELQEEFCKRYGPYGSIKEKLKDFSRITNRIFVTLEIDNGLSVNEYINLRRNSLDCEEPMDMLNRKLGYSAHLNSILSHPSMLGFGLSDVDKKLMEVQDRILHKFGYDKDLSISVAIHSGIAIEELLKYDNFKMTLIQGLIQISNQDIEVDDYIESYVVRRPVNALNIIKIIKKGTDTKEYFYTGKCEGIVVEVLSAVDPSLNTFTDSDINIHKKFLKPGIKSESIIYEGFGASPMQRPMGFAEIMTHTINDNIYMTSVRYKVVSLSDDNEASDILKDIFGDEEDTTDSKGTRYTVIKDNATKVAKILADGEVAIEVQLVGDNEEADNKLINDIITLIENLRKSNEHDNEQSDEDFISLFDGIEDESSNVEYEYTLYNSINHNFKESRVLFDTLIIPENINLSESFKAKYI